MYKSTMTAELEQKIAKIVSDFQSCKDWEQKYEKLIIYGKNFKSLPVSDQLEDLKVKGCQSQVWIKAELSGNKIIFSGDSDALLVKGLVALVLGIYTNETPADILKTEPTFLKDIGLDVGLSPSRSNGLFSMIKQVKYYATAYQYLLSVKK
jgi:cysteine desulfuration protein SufE